MARRHPSHANLDQPLQGWLANWNNKPAVWYDNPDNRLFGKQNRVADIQARLAGPQLISLADMFDIPKDIGRLETLGRESSYLKPYLLHALDAVPSTHPLVPQARAVLEAWNGNVVSDAITSTEFELGPRHLLGLAGQNGARRLRRRAGHPDQSCGCKCAASRARRGEFRRSPQPRLLQRRRPEYGHGTQP